MADLLLRDTDRSELVAEITAEFEAAMRAVMAESTESLLVDGDRLAALLSVSRPTVDRMRADGAIPSVKLGRRRLYRPPDVIEALVANQKGPSHD